MKNAIQAGHTLTTYISPSTRPSLGNVLESSVFGCSTSSSQRSLRKAFWISSVISSLGSFFDYAIVKRWNVDYLSIPDKAFYMFGDAVLESIVGMMAYMPSVVLIAKMCPKNLETTMFAILASFANLGGLWVVLSGHLRWITRALKPIWLREVATGITCRISSWFAVFACRFSRFLWRSSSLQTFWWRILSQISIIPQRKLAISTSPRKKRNLW